MAGAVRQSFERASDKPRVFIQAASVWNTATTGPKWKPFSKFLDTSKAEIITIADEPAIDKRFSPAIGANVCGVAGRLDTDKYPKISIVTPSYNQKDYLEECICSILDQRYPHLEYIIMDGGSTDGSVDIIKKYAKHLAYWQSKPDGGQYAAINEGFKRTTGEIMTWLNSDDKFHPNAFRIVASIFGHRKDVEWIMGCPNIFNEQGELSWIKEFLPRWSREKYLKRDYRFIQQEGTFWRRSLWEKSGATLQTDLELAGDLELWTRFFRFTQLYTVDALIAGYRRHPGQKAQLFMDKYVREAEKILDREVLLFTKGKNKELLPAPEPILISEITKYLSLIDYEVPDNVGKIHRQGEDLFAQGDLEGALNAFTKVVEMAPNFIVAHNNIGRLYLQKGQPTAALKHFTRALKINAHDRTTVLNCGHILAGHGRIEDARRLYLSYLQTNPQDQEILQALTALRETKPVEISQDVATVYQSLPQTGSTGNHFQRQHEKDKFLVTAIVSSYNAELFIRGCLEDLENQTIADKLEIIVVNSSSQENEEAIVREYQQKHDNIVYIKTEQREGIYTAWNHAVKVARGTFLTNANTDDRHREDALEIMSNTLLENPDIALVYGDQICTDTPNGTFANHHATEMARRPEYSRERLLFGCCVGSQPMWRKSLHDEFGYFDDTLTCAGDWDFWLRISSKFKFRHIPEFIGLYFHNEDGIEHGQKIHSLYERYIVGRRYGNSYISVIPLYHDKSDPLVSVIMPAYNAVDYIMEAIESVLIQNYRNFELLIINDGSTDNTEEIVLGFKDERIRYYRQENRGLAATHNVGIKQSRGEFIIKLDCDDMMVPDFIAKHLQEFEKHPEADLIYCDDCLIDEDSKPIRVIERPEYTDRKLLIRDLFRGGFPVVPFRTCIRRSVFDKIGFFDEELLVGEDYDMMRRFIKQALKAHHLKAPLYIRRMTRDSLSRRKPSSRKVEVHFELMRRFTETFSCDELFPDVEWDKIAPERRQLHAKCLAAVTYLAIGQHYVELNSLPIYAKMAFGQACSELSDCLKIDPNNHRIQQLLHKCELGQQKYDEKIQQAVC
ncbi:MAG: glycosyltransferase [Planctomycetota bacterium]|jgi:glycosyltransferase involved in cell wall biosynthesis